jgi:hypothetical protein
VDEVGEGGGGIDGAVVGVGVHGCYEAFGYLVSVRFCFFYGEDLEGWHFVD